MGIFDRPANTSAPDQQTETQPQTSQSPAQGGSMFDRIGGSTPGEGGVYVLPGVYLIAIDAFKTIRSRKGQDMFVAELEILQSSVQERPVGTKMSYVVNFAHDAGPGNVKALLAATMNVPVDQVDSAGAQMACSDANPARGRLVRLEASNTKTRAGNDFTLCRFAPVPNEQQEQSAELRAHMGFAQ